MKPQFVGPEDWDGLKEINSEIANFEILSERFTGDTGEYIAKRLKEMKARRDAILKGSRENLYVFVEAPRMFRAEQILEMASGRNGKIEIRMIEGMPDTYAVRVPFATEEAALEFAKRVQRDIALDLVCVQRNGFFLKLIDGELYWEGNPTW